ncbi:hypothetical protein G5714_000121 [Onychostoma macrolepis]|uniref:Uncharacterized protein n=1 Tax=Onychostoma macrolepis TaxID=369639 RepID=A0A7J6DFL0_9TELE|nr:hypothetical protein G5714_000121 [Onychostoma macrolepis]
MCNRPRIVCVTKCKKLRSNSPEPSVHLNTRRKRQRSESPEPSGVSLKSSRSMEQPLKLSDSTVTSHPLFSSKEIHELSKFVPSTSSQYQTHIRHDKAEFICWW